MLRSVHTLLWVVASLLTLPIQIECIGDGSLRKDITARMRNRLVQPIDLGEVELRMILEFEECIDELNASDLDGNKKVTEEEYVSFISARSRGAIDVEGYSSLPFPLIANYVYGSCFCSFVTGDPNCCVGENSGIDLDVENKPFVQDNLVTVCRTTDEAIMNLIGTFPPTISTTEPPTSTPTNQPTANITETPTATPTLEPTPTPVFSETPTATTTATPTAGEYAL